MNVIDVHGGDIDMHEIAFIHCLSDGMRSAVMMVLVGMWDRLILDALFQ